MNDFKLPDSNTPMARAKLAGSAAYWMAEVAIYMGLCGASDELQERADALANDLVRFAIEKGMEVDGLC